MAVLLKPDGKSMVVFPINRNRFSLREIEGWVGGRIICHRTTDGNVMASLAQQDGKGRNAAATGLSAFEVRGYALVGDPVEMECYVEEEV
jgi:hypothetical protein